MLALDRYPHVRRCAEMYAIICGCGLEEAFDRLSTGPGQLAYLRGMRFGGRRRDGGNPHRVTRAEFGSDAVYSSWCRGVVEGSVGSA